MAGLKGRSGRMPRWSEKKLSDLLNSAWPYEERVAVIESLCSQAKQGNVPAASLLMAYAYGKPTERIEHNIQIEQANQEFQKLRAEFGDVDELQLKEWFAAIKGIEPEQIVDEGMIG